jgi:iron(III) transport system substrate-binding protein
MCANLLRSALGASLLLGGLAAAGELTVYTALEDDQIKPYLASFQAAHPEIKLDIVRNSTGVVAARFLAEKADPKADVIWGLAATALMRADDEGLLAPYAPKGLASIDADFRDAAAVPHWVGIDAWETGIVCNTVELGKRKLPAPRSYAELVEPRYKGLLVMPNPGSSGTGFLTVSGILQSMGEKKGWEYLDRLDRNMARYVHSGSQPAKLAGSGEYAVGLSFMYRGLIQKKKGEPVETFLPAEGAGWDMEANALVRKNAIKPEAKVFLDWAISRSAMVEYQKNYPLIADGKLRRELPAPEGYPKDPVKGLVKNNFHWAAANYDRIVAEWTRRYDSKSDPRK